MRTYPCVLTIAGSDCSGGAGIQADIKAISALGAYAASAITAITVQNTLGVTGIHPVPPAYVKGQIEAVMDDIRPKAVKIGMINDAEIVKVIYEVFTKLDLGKFTVRLNNRKLLNGFFADLDLSREATDILRIIDKIDKIGRDEVRELLLAFEIEAEKVDRILNFLSLKNNVISELEALNIKNEIFSEGLSEIKEVIGYLKDFGIPEENYQIDLSIARGLDYYTGTVYETVLNNYPQIGSVCSGGRYENLTSYYSDKKLLGVGVAIGLSRLFYQLLEAGLIKVDQATPADILIISENISAASELADDLRANGLAVIGAYGSDKFKKKLTLANRLGVKAVIIFGEDEINSGYFSLKDMASGEQIKAKDITEALKFMSNL